MNEAVRRISRSRMLSMAVTVLMLTSALPLVSDLPLAEAAGPMDLSDNAIHRFDMGRRDGPVMTGWTQVQGGLLYSRGAGYGWEAAHEDFLNFRPPAEISPYVIPRSWVIDRYGDDVTRDGVRDAGPMTFSVDLPNGTYRVRATIGDLFYPVYSMNITAEGEQVGAELAAFHLVHRAVYMKDARGNWANYGMPLPYWFSVTVSDGVMDITFDGTDDLFWDRMDAENATEPPESYLTAMSTGGSKQGGVNPPYRFIGGPHTYNSVLGIEIFPDRSDLVTVEGSGLELDPSVTNASVVAAVAGYNSATTQEEYDQLGATVQEMLADHRTGEFTDLKALEELMAHLQGDMVADIDPVQLQDRIDGLRTLLSRDPTDQTLWEVLNQSERLRTALDLIFYRVQTGKNHFYENSKAISLLWSFQPGDALYHYAEMWRARALYMLDPHRWTSSAGTASDIMERLRLVDPDNPYVTMYQDTVPGGGRVWEEGQRVVTTTGLVDHWMKAEVTEGWEGAPQWARWLREELYWLYDITDWWVLNRQQPDGALGGGWSDDVEFIGLFGFDALISQGADDPSLVGARRFVDGMLASGGVDLERGFSTALADAEHTAEWTGDSLPMMIAVDYGNPRWVEFSYKTGVLMRDLWMGETDLGHAHFRSNFLSATRVGGVDTAEDAWINYRAALPAHWVGWYNGDPEVEALFVDWATAWVEDAMRTDDGKPQGVFPASVGFANDELGGHESPNWYTARHPAGTVNYDWQPQMYKGYLEELVRGAYEATGNLSLLEPFLLEAELAQLYLDDPAPSPTPGGAAWAGMVLGAAAIDRWERMRMDYGIDGGGGMSGEPNGYTTEDVIGMTRAGRRYIDQCLPLMTTEASATDRVAFVGIINPFMVYTGGGVGGALLAPKVTYTGLGRDFAACVMDARPSGVHVLMYGFHHGTKDAGLVLWELENGGTYRVTVGDDTDGDGTVDVVDDTSTFKYVTKGQEVPIQLVGGEEKLVVVEQVEEGDDARTLLPDLALAPEDVSANATTGTLDVVVHNIGANESTDYYVIVSDPRIRSDSIIGMMHGVPSLDPPQGMAPSTTVVQVRLSQVPFSDEVLVKLGRGDGGREITLVNNQVLALVNASLLTVNGAPLYTGPLPPEPVVVHEDPLDGGPLQLLDPAGLFTDPDGDTLSFNVTMGDEWAEVVTLEVQDGSITMTHITEDWNGEALFSVTAIDPGPDGTAGTGDDLSAISPDIPLVVLPVNDPPEYVGPPEGDVLRIDEDHLPTLPPSQRFMDLVDLTAIFTDVDGDALRYDLELDEAGDNVTFRVVDGHLRLTRVEPDWNGNVTFTLTAWDRGEDPSTAQDDTSVTSPPYTLLVLPINDPPHAIDLPEGMRLEEGMDLRLNLSGTFEDPDGDALFLRVSMEPSGYIVISPDPTDPDGTTFHLSVQGEWTGTVEVTVTVTAYDRDPDGTAEDVLSDSVTFVVTAVRNPEPVNLPPSAPTITVEPATVVVGGQVLITATGAVDPEGGVLLYRFVVDGTTISDWNASSGLSHTFTVPGVHNITCFVSDPLGAQNSSWVRYEVEKEPVGPGPEPEPHEDTSGWYVALAIVVVAAVAAVVAYILLRRPEGR